MAGGRARQSSQNYINPSSLLPIYPLANPPVRELSLPPAYLVSLALYLGGDGRRRGWRAPSASPHFGRPRVWFVLLPMYKARRRRRRRRTWPYHIAFMLLTSEIERERRRREGEGEGEDSSREAGCFTKTRNVCSPLAARSLARSVGRPVGAKTQLLISEWRERESERERQLAGLGREEGASLNNSCGVRSGRERGRGGRARLFPGAA